MNKNLLILAAAALLPLSAFTATPKSSEKPAMHCDQMKSTDSTAAGKCPMHEGHSDHAAGACCTHGAAHGTNATAMGFSQEATLHHFIIASDGGSIEVTAKNERDSASVEQIRKHLSMLAKQFADGDFSAPQSVHGELPPGVTTMQRLRSAIDFHYIETVAGAKVTMSATDANAIDAIHDFLRYQIREHGTGDAMTAAAK